MGKRRERERIVDIIYDVLSRFLPEFKSLESKEITVLCLKISQNFFGKSFEINKLIRVDNYSFLEAKILKAASSLKGTLQK